MDFRYVISTQTDPYRNLAAEEILMGRVSHNTAILYLWQNADTIVIGRNQDAMRECRAAEFMRDGGRIARRRSGGGAVYHDLGNLNFSIICHSSQQEDCQYQPLVMAALETFGVTAEFNGRNDLTVNSRKCSGNAVYTNMTATCQHGTLLVSTDIEKMERYLTPERAKLERNHIASVKSRVVNLRELNPDITIDNLKRALIYAAKAVKMEYAPDEEETDGLAAVYSSEEWMYGGKP